MAQQVVLDSIKRLALGIAAIIPTVGIKNSRMNMLFPVPAFIASQSMLGETETNARFVALTKTTD